MSEIGMGRPFTVNVGTSPTPLAGSSLVVYGALLRMPSTNTEKVVIGNSEIVAGDPGFNPGETPNLDAPNRSVLIDLNKVFVVSASGGQTIEVYPQV